MVILKDNKTHRILLKMEHFIITTLTLSLNPTPHNYHQTMPTGQTQTNTLKRKLVVQKKKKKINSRRTSSMFSCVHKSMTTGIPVSNQSLQCG